MVQVNFGNFKEYDVNNRFFNPNLAGGALLDIGVYAVSFARYFMKTKPDIVLTTMIPLKRVWMNQVVSYFRIKRWRL